MNHEKINQNWLTKVNPLSANSILFAAYFDKICCITVYVKVKYHKHYICYMLNEHFTFI